MQVLFAHKVSGEENDVNLEKVLINKIEKTKQLYFVYLQYLVEICQYSVTDAARRANKFVPNESDKNVNIDIASNALLQAIIEHPLYLKKIDSFSSKGFIDKKLVKDLFKQLEATEKYVKYCEIKEKKKSDNVEILRYISKKIIGASEMLDEQLSEHFMNLEDDHFITLHSLQKKLKDYNTESEDTFLTGLLLNVDDSDEIEYSKELLTSNLKESSKLDEIIEPRLKNWDMDRVALMDIILLKLAISEFLFFPYIPLKVTMNEYIDISKEYSTTKSKDFINGILDKTMKILQEEGKIKKLGRGLINN